MNKATETYDWFKKTGKIVPRLSLGTKAEGGGVKGTGKHNLTLLDDGKVIEVKDFQGNLIKKLRFMVEEDGQKYIYEFPILGADKNTPHYLLKAFAGLSIGDKFSLEMQMKNGRNVINFLSEATAGIDDEQGDGDSVQLDEGEGDEGVGSDSGDIPF
ncbi:hypothetical protein M1506_00675 [Patescibacteria group bacterium]|nr:hypothetical protein [Patescibacteria group bacterium]